MSPVKENDEEQVQSPDKLLHRLPNNYFIQDDDEEDMEVVMTNIQNMREEMLSYVQKDQMDKKIGKIQNIIEP